MKKTLYQTLTDVYNSLNDLAIYYKKMGNREMVRELEEQMEDMQDKIKFYGRYQLLEINIYDPAEKLKKQILDIKKNKI